MIENYLRLKDNSNITSKYLIEKDLHNLEILINYKLKIPKPKQELIKDELVQEILSLL